VFALELKKINFKNILEINLVKCHLNLFGSISKLI
jgi:hypothetical protein